MADKDPSEKDLEDLLAGLAGGDVETPAKEKEAAPKPEDPQEPSQPSATSQDTLGDQMSAVDEMAAGLEELLSSASITEQVQAVKAEEEAKALEEKMDMDDMESALASALATTSDAESSSAATSFDEIEEAWEESEPAPQAMAADMPSAPTAAVDISTLYQAAPKAAVEEVVVIEPEKLSEKRKRFYAKTLMGVAAALLISWMTFNYAIQPALRYYYYDLLVKAVVDKRYSETEELLLKCEGFGMTREKYLNLSDISLNARDLPHSLGFARKAFDIDPGYIPALNRISRIYLMQGRIDEAQTQAKQTQVVDPNNLEAMIIEATALYRRQETQKSQRIIAEVLAHDRNYVPALELLRDIYVDLKNYNQALSLQQQLTAIKKDIPESQRLLDLGKIYYSAGKFAAANAVLKDAYEKDPSLWEAGYFLAKTQVGLGQYLLASGQIQKTLKEAPNPTLEMFYLRALANFHLGDLKTTIEELQRIRVMNPKYAPLYVLMGKIYIYSYSEYATGLKFLEQARDLHYEDDEFFRALGDAYFHLGRYRDALTAWNPLLAKLTSTDPFLFRVSACLMHLNQLDLAQGILAKMWSSGSRSTAIYNNLGVIHELQGRRDLAMRFYFLATERAVTQGRKDSMIPKKNFDRLISGRGQLNIDESILVKS